MKNEYWGLAKALKIIEDEQERLEEENKLAIDSNNTQRSKALFQQIIAVNSLQKKVQAYFVKIIMKNTPFEPDICTSLMCPGPPNKHCRECSHCIVFGQGTDKHGITWKWEFNPRFGPLFVDANGEPLDDQPIEEDDVRWEPFEAWYAAYRERNEKKEKTDDINSQRNDNDNFI